MFQYAYTRAYAEQNGLELHTPRWIGEKIFQIEPTPEKQEGDLIIGGYCQNASSMIYTRKQVRKWFTFRPEIENHLNSYDNIMDSVRAHRRVGDYKDSQHGYVEVSELSYRVAALKFGYDPQSIFFVTEESPHTNSNFTGDLDFLQDFYYLVKAPVLFRGNSSFSWWSATLGNGRVFSPIIDGLKGGKVEDVEFVEGNHPKISSIGDCTDMHLKEQ